MSADAVRAGLASGRYARGETVRVATGAGRGAPPVAGDLLVDDEVRAVDPPLGRGQRAVAWEVVGHGRWKGRDEWQAQVIGIREATAAPAPATDGVVPTSRR